MGLSLRFLGLSLGFGDVLGLHPEAISYSPGSRSTAQEVFRMVEPASLNSQDCRLHKLKAAHIVHIDIVSGRMGAVFCHHHVIDCA